MIDEASLHHFRELRNQIFFFEEKVMRTFLSIDEDATHRFEEVVKDLAEIGCLIYGGGIGEDVFLKDFEEKLNIAG